MSAMPNTMKLGMALGFLGAIAAFVSMAMAWDGSVDSAAGVGLNMAVSMMFFAIAGCLSSYSPVKPATITAISAVAIGLTFIACILGVMSVVFGILLVAIAAICMVIGGMDTTKDYVDTNRVI